MCTRTSEDEKMVGAVMVVRREEENRTNFKSAAALHLMVVLHRLCAEASA